MNGSTNSKSTFNSIMTSYSSSFSLSSHSFTSSSTSTNSSYQKLSFNSILIQNSSLLNPQIDPQQSRCLFSLLPPETFINICQFLTPWDLVSISLVCRKFRDYLKCTTSFTSMNVWRTSRINTIFFPQLPPPEGLNEMEYC